MHGGVLSRLNEEERAFLQRRVALFGSVAGWLMVVGFVARIGVESWLGETVDLSELSMLFHGLIAVPLLIAWLVCRRGAYGVPVVLGVQAFGLLGAVGCFLVMGLHIPVQANPDMIMTFGLSLVMFARTVYVPIPWVGTLAQCVAIGVALVITSYQCYAGAPPEVIARLHDSPTMPVEHARIVAIVISIWWSLTTILCVGATRVIFGLRRQVAHVRQLGQYTLERRLGQGGMGIVYEARHAMLRRPTAVKLLTPDKSGEASIARFEREVQHTARLTHPNTVTVFDYGRTPDGLFYYAMELIEGATLGEIVDATGPQEPARVIHILAGVAGALSEAHAVDLTHRDIKPANIMLCERGGVPDTVKVLDFGLVKELSGDDPMTSLAGASVIKGTPMYMAPEAISSPDRVDGRSDLYALGAVGYWLVTGAHVFGGENVVEVCGHHLHTQPEPPSQRVDGGVPADLEQLILACLAKRPADRPQSALALQEGLLACGDAGAWTVARARAWWAEHGDAVQQARHDAGGSAGSRTIGVDLEARRASLRRATSG